MRVINLLISLFSIIKAKALECMSVVNQKCMPRPKIIDVNKNELAFYPLSIKINVMVIVTILTILWRNYACQILLKTQILKFLIC